MNVSCADSSAFKMQEDDETEALCSAWELESARRIMHQLDEEMQIGKQPKKAVNEKLNAHQCEQSAQQQQKMIKIWGEFSGVIWMFGIILQSASNQMFLTMQKLTVKENLICSSKHAVKKFFHSNTDQQKALEKLNRLYGDAYTQLIFCLRKLMGILKMCESKKSVSMH